MIPSADSGDCTTTDFFSPEELGLLQCPLVEAETRARGDILQGALERARRRIDSPSFDEPALRWATWVVVSRVLTVQGDPSELMPHKLLIPLIDMFNHHPGSKGAAQVLSGRAVPGGSLRIVAGRDIPAGEQVFIQYGGGAIGSDRFLQDYGFLDRFLPGGATPASVEFDEAIVRDRLGAAD